MEKIWNIKDSKTNRVVIINQDCIYKGNPKHSELIISEKDTDVLNELFSLPFSYINVIENQDGGDKILIYYGSDSKEEIKIKDIELKNEIFIYLRKHIPSLVYSKSLPSLFSYAKGSLIAMLILTLLFLRTYFLAGEIEDGVVYEMIDSKKSISTIMLVLAHVGTFKLKLGYLLVMIIVCYGLKRKIDTRSEIECLSRV